LWGAGDAQNCCYWGEDVKWLVVEVLKSEVVDIDGQKVKFPKGNVVFCGTLPDAAKLLSTRAPHGTPITGGAANAGYMGAANAGYMGAANAGYMGAANAGYMGAANAGNRGAANAGYMGAANAGYMGAANAGYMGAANAGYMGAANAGDRGAANAGDRGAANAGDMGAANAGDMGAANAGDRGAANAGYMGAANAGYMGAANAGDMGAANAGNRGAANAGYRGRVKGGIACALSVLYWDEKRNAYWRKVAVVGENGIEPGVWYEVRDGELVQAVDQTDLITEGHTNKAEIEKRETARKAELAQRKNPS
jgi:hypothetical protein